MKRTVLIALLSAAVGGGIVVAVLAATVGLQKTERVITTIHSQPVAPSNVSVQNSGLTAHQIYERNAPGVAFITSTVVQKTESPFLFGGEGESQEQGTDTGSGILINANGTILTNYHVIANAVKVTASFENGKTVDATVVGKDPSDDLAVLKISTEGISLHPLTLGNSSSAEVGDPAYAIGNPFDLERTLTTGVISALQREITAPNGFKIDNVLQTDAPINPGNSGGPLLNSNGEVIGINSQIETGGGGSDGNVGIGFAVPINTAKQELPQLLKGGTIRGAYLGLTSLTIDGSLSGLGLPVKEGSLVQSVQSGTPAEKAGIHGGDISANLNGEPIELGGDIITGVDGKKVANSNQLGGDISAKKPGETVSIELLRANANGGGYTEHKTVKATLGQRPNSVPNPETPQG
jgi:S1-C subfamily serine protease